MFNTVRMEPDKSVAVFGLGALGLSVIQASKVAGKFIAYPFPFRFTNLERVTHPNG